MKGVGKTQEIEETDYSFDLTLAKGEEFHNLKYFLLFKKYKLLTNVLCHCLF